MDGVLTKLAPSYYIGGEALFRLMHMMTNHAGLKAGSFSTEPDIVISEDRVARADAAYLTQDDKKRQKLAARAAGRNDPKRTRILIPPTLIIECISPGHERHDHFTKRRWYGEFGVANYWLLDPFKQTLRCLALRAAAYEDDAAGQNNDEVRPPLFPGLVLRLADVWDS